MAPHAHTRLRLAAAVKRRGAATHHAHAGALAARTRLDDRLHTTNSQSTVDYLQRLDYDHFGQRVYQRLGNGVETAWRYEPKNEREQHGLSRFDTPD